MKTSTFLVAIAAFAAVAYATPSSAEPALHAYDSTGRLVSHFAGGVGLTYTYDNNGNLLTRTACSGACFIDGNCAALGANPTNPCEVCEPSTSIVAWTLMGDGASCDDGSACTTGETCQSGACSGTPVICTAQDECHVAGTCAPGTGVCSNPNQADGTPCSVGTCMSGVCTPVTGTDGGSTGMDGGSTGMDGGPLGGDDAGPSGGDSAEPGKKSGGCNSTGGQPALWALLLGLALFWGRRRLHTTLGLLLAVALCVPSPAQASRVCQSGMCDYTTIGEAVSNASDGETIVVEAGVYNETGIQVTDQNVTIQGENPVDPGAVIIDGGMNTVAILRMGSGGVLAGVTVRNGIDTLNYGGAISLGGGPHVISHCIIEDSSSPDGGGGIYTNVGSSQLLLHQTIVRNNSAEDGAGIWFRGDRLLIVDSDILDNTATGIGSNNAVGGGIFMDAVYVNIQDSTISGNVAQSRGPSGGAIHVFSDSGRSIDIMNTAIDGNMALGTIGTANGGGINLTANTFTMLGGSLSGNIASTDTGLARGGGLRYSTGNPIVVSGVDISGNTAVEGGGVWCSGRQVSFAGTTVSGNTPDDFAGSCVCTPDAMQACTTGLPGPCATGTQTCLANMLWGECVPDTAPTVAEENCSDGVDNDCRDGVDAADPDCAMPGDNTSGDTAHKSGCSNDPVNTATGALFEQLPPDIDLGGPLPVYFARYYGSDLDAAGIAGSMGTNWRHTYEWTLSLPTATTIRIIDPQGRHIDFEEVSSSNWQRTSFGDVPFQLVESGSLFDLADPRTNLIYSFDGATGELLAISDTNDNTLSLIYATGELLMVDDGLGRVLDFTHVGGELTQVSDGTRSVNFTFNTGDLETVTDVRGNTTTYGYTAGGLLISTTRPETNAPYSHVYDGSSRVTTQTDALGNTHTFSYDTPSAGVTTLEDPLTNSRTHTHNVRGEFTSATDRASESFAMDYNGDGVRAAVNDRTANTTFYETHAPTGKLAAIHHPDGTSIRYEYTLRFVGGFSFYDLRRIIYPDGTAREFTYDISGNLLTELDQSNGLTTNFYDEFGQLLATTNPAGGTTLFTYNADGTMASVEDPASNVTTFGYDALGRINSVQREDASLVTFTHDAADNILTVVDSQTVPGTQTFTYDLNGNLSTITDRDGYVTTYTYDGMDRVETISDDDSNIVIFAYDELERLASITNRAGDTVSFTYDARGRRTAVTDGESQSWPRTFDVESIVATSGDPLGNTTTFTTDVMGRVTGIQTAGGGTFNYSYDALGRVSSITDPTGVVTARTYEARGLLAAVTQGVLSASYTYDALGRPATMTDPNSQTWQQAWDISGRLTSKTDPLGNVVSYAYDNRNRVSGITFPGAMGTLTVGYDANGNATSRTYSDGTAMTYAYDARDRLVSSDGLAFSRDLNNHIVDSNGLPITRDAAGRISTIQYDAGKVVTYTYDGRGNVATVTDWVTGMVSLSYDNAGRLTSITRPNGVDTTYGWDADRRITSITDGAVAQTTLTRDLAGKTTESDRVSPEMASATPADESFTYDAASQVSAFAYDAMGRVTDDGVRTYTWDLATRLTGYAEGATTVTFDYDGMGQRISRVEDGGPARTYVWNYATPRPTVAVIADGGADTRYYVYTPNGTLLYSVGATDDARHYYHYDEMGNTLLLTNDAGMVAASYAYGPYGEDLGSSGSIDNPFTWQGEWGIMREGPSGLYYARARYYDSRSARFISRDFKVGAGLRSINPYHYANGNPLRFVDSAGTDPETPELNKLLGQVLGQLEREDYERKRDRLVKTSNLHVRPTPNRPNPGGPAPGAEGGDRTVVDVLIATEETELTPNDALWATLTPILKEDSLAQVPTESLKSPEPRALNDDELRELFGRDPVPSDAGEPDNARQSVNDATECKDVEKPKAPPPERPLGRDASGVDYFLEGFLGVPVIEPNTPSGPSAPGISIDDSGLDIIDSVVPELGQINIIA